MKDLNGTGLEHGDAYRDLVLEIQYETGSIQRAPEARQSKLLMECLDKMKNRLRLELLTRDLYHFEQLFMEFWRIVQKHRGSLVYLYSAVYFADYLELSGKSQEEFVFCFEQDADARVLLDEGHPCRLMLQERLGIAYYQAGQYDMAYELIADAWIDYSHQKSGNVWMRQHMMKYLALAAYAVGETLEAQKLAKRMFAMCKKQYGENSIYMLDAYDVMVQCFMQEGVSRTGKESRTSKKMFEEYMRFCNYLDEPTGHPCTLHISNLVTRHRLFNIEKGYKDVIRKAHFEGAQECLRMLRQIYGDHHQETFYALYNVAWMAECMGEAEKALYYYQKCFETAEEGFGKWHSYVLDVLEKLAACHETLQDEQKAEMYRQELTERKNHSRNERLDYLIEESTNHLKEIWALREEQEEEERIERQKMQEEEKKKEEEEMEGRRQKAAKKYNKLLKKNLTLFVLVCLLVTAMGQVVTKAGTSEKKKPAKPVMDQKIVQTKWSLVRYGSYPQSEVKDAALLAELRSQNEKCFDAKGDILYKGEKYRRLCKEMALNTDTAAEYYDWSTCSGNKCYHFFKYEPILWRVLNVDEKGMLLLADSCLDDRKFNIEDEEVCWNNSTVRSWLNSYAAAQNLAGRDYSKGISFMDTAFSESEQQFLLERNITESANPYYDKKGGKATSDKVFLLSLKEVMQQEYGFYSKADASNTRVAECSDYAFARGLYVDVEKGKRRVWWWLRSVGKMDDEAAGVLADGYTLYNASEVVDNVECGICPAIYLSLDADWQLQGSRLSEPDQTPQPVSSAGPETSATPITSEPTQPTAAPQLTISPEPEPTISPEIPQPVLERVHKPVVRYKSKQTAQIKWKKIEGAGGYELRIVYRDRTGWVKGKDIYTTRPSYLLKKCEKNKKYYIKVRAVQNLQESPVYGQYSKIVVYKHKKGSKK